MGNFVRLSKRNIYQLYSLYPLHAEREVIIRFGKYHIIEEKYIPLLRIKIARKLPMLMSKKFHDFFMSYVNSFFDCKTGFGHPIEGVRKYFRQPP